MSDRCSGESQARQSRLARRLVAATLVAVSAIFVAARLSHDLGTGHYFDYLHWTIAYSVSATLGWMGVRCARDNEITSRRWFACGLTITLLAQLLFDLQEITHRTPIVNL